MEKRIPNAKKLLPLLVTAMLLPIAFAMAGCATDSSAPTQTASSDSAQATSAYKHIDQETAMQMMAEESGYVIVDVRRQDEYDAGHIPGAILIPNESIGKERPKELSDLDQTILIYCRTGNRAGQAAQKLADMGYTNVYEFGGIETWTGEIEKSN